MAAHSHRVHSHLLRNTEMGRVLSKRRILHDLGVLHLLEAGTISMNFHAREKVLQNVVI